MNGVGFGVCVGGIEFGRVGGVVFDKLFVKYGVYFCWRSLRIFICVEYV